MKQDSLTKFNQMLGALMAGKSTSTTEEEDDHGGGGDFDDTSELSHHPEKSWAPTRVDNEETSELSVAANWAPTKRVDSDGEEAKRVEAVVEKEESSDEGVEDSPLISRPLAPVEKPVGLDDVVNEDDETSMSEYMIRVNTGTDLKAENPLGFFSPTRDVVTTSDAKVAKESPTRKEGGIKPSERTESPKKHVPSASLRVQHNDIWLRQVGMVFGFLFWLFSESKIVYFAESAGRRGEYLLFVLTIFKTFQKLKQLEAIGEKKSSFSSLESNHPNT